MAEQRVVLDFFVNGTSRIDKLVNQVTQLQGVVDSLNQVPLEINVKKATSQFERLDSELKLLESTLKGQKASFSAANKSINDQQKAIDKSGTSIEKYQDQLVSIQRQLQSLNPGTKKYNDLLDRQNKIIKDYASAQSDLAEAQDKLLESQKNKSIIGERLEKAKTKVESGRKLQSEAKKLKDLTEALDGLATQYLELGIAQKKAKETTPLASGLDIRAARPRTQENPSIAQLNSQASALDLIAKNSSVASSQFNRFTIATEVASQRIYEAGQQKLKALAFGLSKQAESVNIGVGGPKTIAAARDTIDSLIGSYGGVVKSEAALSSYISRLQSLQSLVPYLSEEYNKLERAIGDVSAEMESLQKMTQLRGAVSKIQPQAGPASLLPSESVKSAADKTKYYSKIDDQVSRLAGFEERIAQANLTQTQKLELRARLDKALSLLSENRLDDAKRETIEIERQRMSLERMNRASKPASEVKPLGPSTALGTGAELRERNKYEAEGIKLRDKITKATNDTTKATNDAAAAVQRLEAAQDRISFVQELEEIQAGIQDVGDEVDKFLSKEKKASTDFKERLREASKVSKQVKQGVAVDLGGGAELKERAKFDQSREQSARKLNNIIASGAIIEQGLINLERKGADVTETLVGLQQSLNSAKKDDFEVTQQTVDALGDQVSLAGKFAQLQNKILAGQAKGGKAQAGGSGLEAALKSLQEARGAGKAFLGGASPAEAIDKIVRQFGTKKDIGAGIGENITNTFASDLLSGGKQMASAATSAFTSVVAAIKKVFGIASPSRVMREIAENLISSFITELISNIPSVKAALEKTFDVQRSTYEQSGRRLSGRPSFPVELDPGFLAAVSGTPLTPGRPSPASIFSGATPRVGAPGSPFPYQTYNLATTQFPTDAAAQLSAPRNRGTDANRVLSEAIREYRAAVDNFWEGEDSQFEAIKKIVVSSTRLASAQLARRLQQTKDLTPDQQFQQIAREARSAIAAGGQSRFSRGVTAVGNIINGDRDLGVSRFLVNAEDQAKAVFQRMSDSILNSIEAFGFSVGNLFGDGLDRIRGLVPGAVSRGLSSISEAITDFGGIGGFGGFGGGGAGGGVPAGGGGAVNQTAQLLGFDAIADISRVSTRELEALSAAASELRAILDPTIEGFDRLDNQLRETIGNIGRQLERRDPNADFLTRRLGPRGGRAVSEGLIGGAFPLLFGQGAGASLGGLLGGAAGGFAGGNLGFGLSLIGTALGTAFDTAVQGAIELGSALEKPVENFDKLTEKSFISSKALETQIRKTIEYGDVATASALIQEEAFKKLGVGGVNNLKNLGSESDRLNRAFAELGQQMQAVAAGPLSNVTGFFADIFGQAAAAGRVRLLRADLNPQQAEQFNQEVLQRLKERGVPRGFFAPSTPTESEIGILQQQGALQDIVDKWQALTIKGKIKITEKERLQSELNGLQKQLEVIDIGMGLTTQIRQAAREQQDLDRQRADLVRSYEESIGSIRQRIEDEVANKRFATIQKENDLLDLQGQIRLKSLEVANRGAIAEAGAGQRPEVEQAAKEVAGIVGDFTEQQLTAEEEAAKIKRDAALEAQKLDFEGAKFKADIEKEVSKLNVETARKVAEINEQVKRRNEEYDQNRFKLEKRIAEVQLRQALSSAQEQIAAVEKQLQLTDKTNPEAQQNIKYFNNLLQVYKAQEAVISSAQSDIAGISAPAPLRGVGAVGGGGVSTGGLDKATADYKAAINNFVQAQLALNELTAISSVEDFKAKIDAFIKKTNAPIDLITQNEIDAMEERLGYARLINEGLTDAQAKRVIEIQQATILADLTYEAAIAELERKKAMKGTTDAMRQQIDLEIAKLEIAREGSRDRMPGIVNTAIESERGKQIFDFIVEAKAQLNNLEAVAISVSQGIGNAIGNSLANGISGLIEGTTTAKQIFADFLKSVGQILVQEGTKMIGMYIAIAIAKAIAGLAGGGASGGGTDRIASFNAGVAAYGFANGGAFSSYGVMPFANGGVVNSPTLFKFADGGAMRTGVMGEAGPEAIMPLRRGSDGRLGVEARGLREAMNGGSGAPVLNMSFETTNIGGVEYVSRDQLEAAMAATRKQASADGAKRGMSMTLDKLQQSPQTRSRLGIRS